MLVCDLISKRLVEWVDLNVIFPSFRHFYSDIFSVISAIDRQVTFGNVEVLSQNMDIIRKGYHPMNKDNTGKTINIEKQINKLYDHINLEISRLNYSKQIEVGTQMQLDNVSDALAEIERNVEHMEDAVEKADDIQKQYILEEITKVHSIVIWNFRRKTINIRSHIYKE